MPNPATQSPSVNKGNYLILDSQLKEVLENRKTVLNGRLYSELPYNQKITVSQINKQISQLSWQCFEEAKKQELFNLAAEYFVMAFELGWYKAVKLYRDALDRRKFTPIQHTATTATEENNSPLTPHELALQGVRYTLALGYPKDYEKALNCFKEAAQSEDSLGQCGYGMALEYGAGIPENRQAAMRCYMAALERESKHAKFANRLGLVFHVCYEIALLIFAAEQGNAAAQHALGDYYQVKNNTKEAVYWLRLSAEQGNPDAQYDLWSHYKRRDSNLALYWYRLAIHDTQRTADISELLMCGPMGEYTMGALLNTPIPMARLLLSHDELRQEFLNHELDNALSSEEGLQLLGDIIKSLTADPKAQSPDINHFLSILLVSLVKKSKSFSSIISPLIKAVNYAETHPDRIERMMDVLIQIWNMNKGDDSCLRGLRSLWYRALSIGYKIDNKTLLMQIASILISRICNEAYTLNSQDFESLQISLLFSFDKTKQIHSIEQLNLLLESNLLTPIDPSEPGIDKSLVVEHKKNVPNEHQFFMPVSERKKQLPAHTDTDKLTFDEMNTL